MSKIKLIISFPKIEIADASIVIIHGFLGTSSNEDIRLYDSPDISSYVEIPKEAIIHIEPDECGDK